MNLRNTPIDKRRLKREDRQFNTSRRERALKTARRRRGNLAYQERRELNTTTQKAGTGGFTQGISIQQARLRDKGARIARSKSFRPEDPA